VISPLLAKSKIINSEGNIGISRLSDVLASWSKREAPLTRHRFAVRATDFHRQTHADAHGFRAPHTGDSGRKLRREQPDIGRLSGQLADRRHSYDDRR